MSIKINIYDSRITQLVDSLKLKYISSNKDIFTLFEETYQCKIVSTDPFGISGYVLFKEGQYYTWFLLQNDSNNEQNG